MPAGYHLIRGHRLVWLGHWPSKYCIFADAGEESPQPGTSSLVRRWGGNSNPGDRMFLYQTFVFDDTR